MNARACARLHRFFQDFPPSAVDLLEKIFVYDPEKRLSAQQAIGHPFFSEWHQEEQEPTAAAPFDSSFEQLTHGVEGWRALCTAEVRQFRATFGAEPKHLKGCAASSRESSAQPEPPAPSQNGQWETVAQTPVRPDRTEKELSETMAPQHEEKREALKTQITITKDRISRLKQEGMSEQNPEEMIEASRVLVELLQDEEYANSSY